MKNSENTKTNIESELFAVKEKTYGDDYKKHLLEQYRLYVEMSDRISSRRSSANTFFLTANTSLLTIIGFASKLDSFNMWWVILTSIGGIVFSLNWFKIIQSYRQLNAGKYEIINMIEKKLPLAVYKAEWSYLKQPSKYTELTNVEKIVPIIFAGLYAVLIIIGLYIIYFNPRL